MWDILLKEGIIPFRGRRSRNRMLIGFTTT